MKTSRWTRTALAVTLTLTMSAMGLSPLAAPPLAQLSGRILRSGTGVPIEGAVMKLSHSADARTFDSAVSDAKGQYTLSGLPPGAYEVAVEADGGFYLVGPTVSLSPGERRSLSLALVPEPETPAPAPGEQPPVEPAPEDEDEEEEAAPLVPEQKSFFRTAWGGLVLILGSAAVIAAAVAAADDDDPASASPSSN